MNDSIPYGRQSITQNDINAVIETLRSDFLTQGPKIAEFEKAFADYIGCKYAVAVSNGTAALHLSALVLGVKNGSKVITSPNTFVASANCVLYCGGSVDFVDIDPSSALLDLNALEKKLRSSPKGTYQGVIPVDFAGYPVDLEKLRVIADEYGLWIIEDACHSPGGSFQDSNKVWQNCGNGKYSDLAIFSFHPVKHIACGEGGMITTNRKDLYERLLLLRTHGISKDSSQFQNPEDSISQGGWYYEMQFLGYNYRISDILAALGISQLSRATEGILRRREIANRYNKAFLGSAIVPIIPTEKYSHAYHLYVVKVPDRKIVFEELRKEKIFTQVHYIPVHLQPFYQNLGFKKGDFPIAENYYERAISLPMFPSLTDYEVNKVIQVLGKVVN